MFLSKLAPCALVVALVHASPVPKAPTRVVRRELPEPSSYPLGDACDHEWKYLNFNKDDDTDKARLEMLHDVLCSGELRALAAYGETAATGNGAPYQRYFPPNEDDDNTQEKVASVLKFFTGESSADGMIGKIVEEFIIDNLGKSKCLRPNISFATLFLTLTHRRLCRGLRGGSRLYGRHKLGLHDERRG